MNRHAGLRNGGSHLFCALFFVLTSTTAFAQTDWVNQFLLRHQSRTATGVALPAAAPPASLSAMIQDGAAALTTQDVIRLLLDNNRDVVVSRRLPLSSLYSIRTLGRPFEPNFHASGVFTHTTSPSSNVLSGAVSLVERANNYTLGIDQTLQTGTSYTVDFEVSRLSSNSVFYVYNPSYNGMIRYSVTQHLLRDFGKLVNTHEIRIARNNEKISELDFELEIIDQVTTALESYWDLVFAIEDVKVKQRSLDFATKTLSDNRIQVDIGTMAMIDLIQAEAEVATRTEDLVIARYTVDQLQDELKKMITAETDPGLVLARLNLVESVRRPGGAAVLPLHDGIRFALQNRSELKQADYDIENQNINVGYTKNQTRPVLDISAGYAHSGLGGTQTIRSGIGQDAEIISVVPGGINDMFKTLFEYKYPGYSASFNLRIPLGNNAAKADYHRALNERELSTSRRASVAQRIVLEVRNAYTQIELNDARVATARTARLLSTRRLDAEQAKFQAGASTVRFVLEEQRNLAQAETNEIQALVNYTKAIVVYDQAIGNTLARNNIALDKQMLPELAAKN